MIGLKKKKRKLIYNYRATHNPPQRIPRPVIKPVEEIVEAMLHHVMCGPVIEPEA